MTAAKQPATTKQPTLTRDVLYVADDGSRHVAKAGEKVPAHFTKAQRERLQRIGAAK